ncbi:site-specific integrase [Bacillus sp. DNRA2]|uniref:site-specific integrase n=1 Tax=Bacillus sp. DNRA2 TaxID=2723053 RepID=UPI00145CAB7B|nr:site-specific integrase [Bacillus sp. DNRA2]NMD69595.1 site-specific integrase [Bacillus sp. DNRA2]
MNVVEPIRNKRDIDRMKKALHGRDQLLFIFGINSALRISDILALKVGDVRGKESITLTEKKTGKSKQFRVNKAISQAVKKCVPANAADNDYLFPSRKGNGAISRVQAYRILNEAAGRAGLTVNIGTHTLRKTMAYHAYQSGVDISLLMNVLNHSSQRETLRYIGITQDQVNGVFEALNL